MFLADTISQIVEKKSKKKKVNIDFKKLSIMTFWGFGVFAPIIHFYYASFLTKSFNYEGAKGIIAKVSTSVM